MDEIVDHQKSKAAVSKEDGWQTTWGGERRRKTTTKGWDFFNQWKDGNITWTPLKDIKESYMVETTEYAGQRRIHDEPAFAWWVPVVLKKRKAILSKVKSKYCWETTHKHSIEVPRSVKQAKEIDQ